MESKDLVVLRNEVIAALKDPQALPAAQPAEGGRKGLLAVFTMSAVLSVAVVMWLHILTNMETNPIPSVQSVSIQAQTPPPEAEIARPFETVTAVDDVERTQQVAAAEPDPALPKFQAWAAQNNAEVPTETTQPPTVAPAGDAQPKTSAAQDREREQEALADKRWEERHARRLAAAAARKTERRTPQSPPAQQQQAQQAQARKPQQPQQQQQPPKLQQAQRLQPPAPTASVAPPAVPQASESMRGGG